MIFKKIKIKLTGPICQCDQQNLAWAIQPYANQEDPKIIQYGVNIICNTCGTKLMIPNKDFRAAFILAKSYPKGIKTPDEREPDQKDKEDDKELNDFIRNIDKQMQNFDPYNQK